MPKTNPIPNDAGAKTSDDVEARRTLGREAARASRSAPAKSAPSNGNTSVGGRSVSGGAKVRGGRA